MNNITHKDFMKKNKYINELMGCACFSDLLSLKIFPNGKEITESCSAYSFFRNNQDTLFRLDDPTVSVIVVGDGCTPRTASLFAFRSSWMCHSIDPNLKWKNQNRVQRLEIHQNKVEDFDVGYFQNLILLHIHSHATLEESIDKFRANKRVVLSMPCCVKQTRERPPDYEFIDEGIWSPHNKNLIWYDGFD